MGVVEVGLKASKGYTIDVHTVVRVYVAGLKQLHQVNDAIDEEYKHRQGKHVQYEVKVSTSRMGHCLDMA